MEGQLREMRGIIHFITHSNQGGHVHLDFHHRNPKEDLLCLRCATPLVNIRNESILERHKLSHVEA